MKKTICILLSLLMLMLAFTACGTGSQDAESSTSSEAQSEAVAEENTEAGESGNKTLVVFFSATGTTEAVAKTIADTLGADIYKIEPAVPYTEEDLSYNNDDCRANKEQNDDSARPEISGKIENWDQYNTVLIGHPIWWGKEPRIMDTFVESYDFNGKTVATFCTSGSSGIEKAYANLEEKAGAGNWLGGRRFTSDVTADDVNSWVSEIGLK